MTGSRWVCDGARADLVGEAAACGGQSGFAGRHVSDQIDGWCGTPPRHFPWPRPGLRLGWADRKVGALDEPVLAGALHARLASGIGGDVAEGIKDGTGELVGAARDHLRA